MSRRRSPSSREQRQAKLRTGSQTNNSIPTTSCQPANVFSFLERDFAEIIFEIRDGGADGRLSTKNCARKTIIFRNETKLHVTEYVTPDGWIDYYYYDWVTPEGKTILKWHSEPHDTDKRYQTVTEPYHIHLPSSEILHNMYRLSNFEHQTLRLTFRTLAGEKERIFYFVFQNNVSTNTTSDGNPFFTIASRSI